MEDHAEPEPHPGHHVEDQGHDQPPLIGHQVHHEIPEAHHEDQIHHNIQQAHHDSNQVHHDIHQIVHHEPPAAIVDLSNLGTFRRDGPSHVQNLGTFVESSHEPGNHDPVNQVPSNHHIPQQTRDLNPIRPGAGSPDNLIFGRPIQVQGQFHELTPTSIHENHHFESKKIPSNRKPTLFSGMVTPISIENDNKQQQVFQLSTFPIHHQGLEEDHHQATLFHASGPARDSPGHHDIHHHEHHPPPPNDAQPIIPSNGILFDPSAPSDHSQDIDLSQLPPPLHEYDPPHYADHMYNPPVFHPQSNDNPLHELDVFDVAQGIRNKPRPSSEPHNNVDPVGPFPHLDFGPLPPDVQPVIVKELELKDKGYPQNVNHFHYHYVTPVPLRFATPTPHGPVSQSYAITTPVPHLSSISPYKIKVPHVPGYQTAFLPEHVPDLHDHPSPPHEHHDHPPVFHEDHHPPVYHSKPPVVHELPPLPAHHKAVHHPPPIYDHAPAHPLPPPIHDDGHHDHHPVHPKQPLTNVYHEEMQPFVHVSKLPHRHLSTPPSHYSKTPTPHYSYYHTKPTTVSPHHVSSLPPDSFHPKPPHGHAPAFSPYNHYDPYGRVFEDYDSGSPDQQALLPDFLGDDIADPILTANGHPNDLPDENILSQIPESPAGIAYPPNFHNSPYSDPLGHFSDFVPEPVPGIVEPRTVPRSAQFAPEDSMAYNPALLSDVVSALQPRNSESFQTYIKENAPEPDQNYIKENISEAEPEGHKGPHLPLMKDLEISYDGAPKNRMIRNTTPAPVEQQSYATTVASYYRNVTPREGYDPTPPMHTTMSPRYGYPNLAQVIFSTQAPALHSAPSPQVTGPVVTPAAIFTTSTPTPIITSASPDPVFTTARPKKHLSKKMYTKAPKTKNDILQNRKRRQKINFSIKKVKVASV